MTLLTKKRAKRTKNQSRARGRANRSREKKIGIVLLLAKIKAVLAQPEGQGSPSRDLGDSCLWLQLQVRRRDEISVRFIPALKFHYSDIHFTKCSTKCHLPSMGKG